MNNDLRDLEYEEKKEIIRILTEFTNQLRPELPEIIEAYQFMGQIDFIRAKALVALDMGASKPRISDTPRMIWYEAINPLLSLSQKRQKKEVVPLTFELNEKQHILVISGPNAGGKSVCLKTAGLLQYMLQNGMLVPMKDYSETGIFKQIFIEIGDEQSIENDLSTYSSHLRNLKYFCDNITSSTLFLIDEFGSGTEPHLGGAIAEAVLVHLSNVRPFGIVTTHYGNLKLLAGKIPGVVNGAMLFDTKKMKPVYKLAIGNPGSSYAFEIAGQIGFSKDVLENAARLTGGTQLDYDRQLKELEVEKEELLKKQIQINVADEFLSEMIEKYRDLLEKLEQSKREIIVKAKSDAANLLTDANRTIENTIREIRENQADKEKTRQLRQDLASLVEDNVVVPDPKNATTVVVPEKQKKTEKSADRKKVKNEAPAVYSRPAKIGDYVKLIGHEGTGVVEEIKNKSALVIINSMKLWWPLDELGIAGKGEYESSVRKMSKSDHRSIFNGLDEKSANFKPLIDVRGKRAEEVHGLISAWLDDAILLRVHELRILHGKGNGVLRSVIRELLSRTREVRSFRDEILEQGGHGITVVEIE
jgi:DNA mismatch repair protein MutS2